MTARTRCGMIGFTLACLALFGCSTQPAAVSSPQQVPAVIGTAQPAPVSGSILLGIYYGNHGWKMNQVQQLERWQDKKYAVVNMFTNWCSRSGDIDNLFGQQLPNIWNNGNVPVITWEPYLCSPAQTPPDVEVQAARGSYDAYFNTWADRLKTFLSGPDGVYNTEDDRRAYVRMGHEMNGNWYPWSAAVGKNAPGDFVRMWKRVKAIFDARDLEATHLQWIWAANNDDVGGFPLEQYYPGDTWVDWVAVDGFNFGESQSWSNWRLPADCYDEVLRRLHKLTTKPIALVEFASSSSTTSGNSDAAKSKWITALFSYAISKKLRMVAWFNEDKETDWALFGGRGGDVTYQGDGTAYKGYLAYKTAVSDSHFIAADTKNVRHLTDAQFAGQ